MRVAICYAQQPPLPIRHHDHSSLAQELTKMAILSALGFQVIASYGSEVEKATLLQNSSIRQLR
eukprot:560817-Karenia_brevis.AAC.1